MAYLVCFQITEIWQIEFLLVLPHMLWACYVILVTSIQVLYDSTIAAETSNLDCVNPEREIMPDRGLSIEDLCT